MCLLKSYEQFNHFDTEKELKEAGLWDNAGIVKTVWVMVSLINRDETVTIDGVKHPRGALFPTSQGRLAARVGVKRPTMNSYLNQLEDAGIIRKELGGKGSHNCLIYVFTAFDRAAAQLRREIAKRKQEEKEQAEQGSAENTSSSPRLS